MLLYQIICLQNTPPETESEQAQCMKTRATCWRLQQAARGAKKRAAASAGAHPSAAGYAELARLVADWSGWRSWLD